MRRARLPKVCVLVLLIASAMSAACGSASEPRTGISGSVSMRDWGAFGGTVPAADIQVECLDASTREQARMTRTDRGGRFFLSVPAGRYLVAYAEPSRPTWVAAEVVAGKVTTLEPFIGSRGGLDAVRDRKRLKDPPA